MDPVVLNAIVAVAVAVISGMAAWAAGRRNGRADAQLALNTGYKSLVDQLQSESDRAETRCNRILTELQNERQRAQICQSELHIAIRAAQNEVVAGRADIKILEANITLLEGLLKKSHIDFARITTKRR
jgi:hypothetical protein